MKISPDVMSLLSLVACSGTKAVIVEKLDRKNYQAVNKVLEALGGKWNRAAKAHLFPSDAQALLDMAMVTGEVTTRQDIGFFPTPAPLARQLVTDLRVKPGMIALEPSAGTGRIVDALLEAGANVVACERDEKMRTALGLRSLGSNGKPHLAVSVCDDFMRFMIPPDTGWISKDGAFDIVAMNPPFLRSGLGDHLDHVRRAFDMLRSGGRLKSIMPVSVEFRQDRRYHEFREWVLDLGGEIERLPDLSFRESGTDVNTCTVYIEKS